MCRFVALTLWYHQRQETAATPPPALIALACRMHRTCTVLLAFSVVAEIIGDQNEIIIDK